MTRKNKRRRIERTNTQPEVALSSFEGGAWLMPRGTAGGGPSTKRPKANAVGRKKY